MKRTAREMHYEGVSSTRSTQTSTRPDPLDPLVRRYLLEGDEEAMDALVERTRPRLLAVARRIGAPQDAEDAVQGAYMALLRKRGTGLDAPVLPWLMTTVVRLAYRRKAKHQRQRDLAARLARPRERDDHPQLAPEQRALADEREVIVRAGVARLPARYRDAVVLRHLEGLSTREAATLLEIPEATLRTRLHRAVRLLRSRMAPVVLGSLLFVPWALADAARRAAPLVRPVLGGRLVPAAVAVLAVVGGLGLWWPEGGTGAAPGGGAADAPTSRATPGTTRGRTPPRPTEAAGSDPREESPSEVPAAGEAPPPGARPASPPAPLGAPNAADGSPRTPPGDLPPRLPPRVVEIATDNEDAPPPPGMVRIEGGWAEIGTPQATLDTLLAGRPEPVRALFRYETPRHAVALPTYWIGRYEVTNAQYLRFLEDQRVTHTTHSDRADTLERLAGRLMARGGASPEQRAALGSATWRQLYEGNRGAIWRAFDRAGRSIVVLKDDGSLDAEATARRARREPLPAGLSLELYRYPPPMHWPALRPSPAQAAHPVRFISYDEAERFATWAGMHVPTEAEWEWAARGPEGRRFPWGEAWAEDASRANWGGKITDDAYETTTLPVDSLPAGRSWCGVHHLVGNVAEWTSSWFEAYPGSTAPRSARMGRWAKVIRGGSAADMDTIVLRSAVRNFVGAGPDAPPYPSNRFGFVGFRLAAYAQAGRDQVAPLLRRVADGHLDPEVFAAERFGGFVQRQWAAPGETPPDHVYVRGPATAVVLVPVTRLLRPGGLIALQAAARDASALRTAAALVRRSGTEEPLFVAGALHLDLPLVGVDVPTGAAPSRRRGRPKPPPTAPGRCEPGTYLVALWFGRVVLTTPTREPVCFLPEPADDLPSVEVRPRSSLGAGPPTLRPDLDAAVGGLDLAVPLGGLRRPDAYTVRLRARLPYDPDAFAAAAARGAWITSPTRR